MSLFSVIVGLAAIVLGAWASSRSLALLTIGRAKPEMTRPGARTSKWRLLGISLVQIVLGVRILTNWLEDAAASRLLGIAAAMALIWLISSDLGSWRRSRQRRTGAGPTAEPP
jgi:hypothetical protein